jgi:ornithine cyclodeaminase
MRDDDLLILKGEEVHSLLAGRELELVQIVQSAYVAHRNGQSSLPHSTFLRFPQDPSNRIIALPGYLGDESRVAGIKWVSSFPANLGLGMDRASAIIILNSPVTGRPEAILEGSIISSKRTAASAALAAHHLHQDKDLASFGIIGCGLINFEIARFILALFPSVKRVTVFDKDARRAQQFGEKLRDLLRIEASVSEQMNAVLEKSPLISLATTATEPHIDDLSSCRPGSTILHISLRDLSAEAILSCDNVVDDVEHVCRAETSIHLAEQRVGNREFIRCSVGDVVTGSCAARREEGGVTVFSPFGLGVLDLAVAKRVRDLGLEGGFGTIIKSFIPDSWTERVERVVG